MAALSGSCGLDVATEGGCGVGYALWRDWRWRADVRLDPSCVSQAVGAGARVCGIAREVQVVDGLRAGGHAPMRMDYLSHTQGRGGRLSGILCRFGQPET